MSSPETELLIAENKRLQEQLHRLRSEMAASVNAAEQAASRQRDFLWSLIDTLPERIYVKDQAGRFLLVNKTMSEAWGVPVEEFVGKSNADIHQNPAVAKMLDETDGKSSLSSRASQTKTCGVLSNGMTRRPGRLAVNAASPALSSSRPPPIETVIS